MNNKNTTWLFLILILGIYLTISGSCKKDENDNFDPTETVTDFDGNIYHQVKIGDQIWLAENLKVTHYSNGDPIEIITDSAIWTNMTTPAFCNYNNDAVNNDTYGRLYNWYALNDSRKLAPQGWHIPSDAEWTTLVNHLGGTDVAGGTMKTTGTTHWQTPNTGATNSSGLNVLPGGCRIDGIYDYLGTHALFWTSTSSSPTGAYYRSLSYGGENVYLAPFSMAYGLSIRCVKD